MSKNILNSIVMLIAIAAVFVLTQKYISQIGIDNCLKSSKIETIIKQGDQTQTVTQPNGGWYATCLKDKGLK